MRGSAAVFVFVIFRAQFAENQSNGRHVLQAMIAVGGIVEQALLVNNAEGGFVGCQTDAFNFRQAVFDPRMKLDGGFDRGLGVELGGKANFKEHVLHHMAAQRAGQANRLGAEERVAKTPGFGGENGGITHFVFQGHERVLHGPGSGVSRRPRFARAGVGRVPVNAQRPAIRPGIGESVDDLFARAAQKPRRHGR